MTPPGFGGAMIRRRRFGDARCIAGQRYQGLSGLPESSLPIMPLTKSPGVRLIGLVVLALGFQSVWSTWKVMESTSASVSRTVVVSVPYLRRISGLGMLMPMKLLGGPSLRPSAASATVRV